MMVLQLFIYIGYTIHILRHATIQTWLLRY